MTVLGGMRPPTNTAHGGDGGGDGDDRGMRASQTKHSTDMYWDSRTVKLTLLVLVVSAITFLTWLTHTVSIFVSLSASLRFRLGKNTRIHQMMTPVASSSSRTTKTTTTATSKITGHITVYNAVLRDVIDIEAEPG